MTRFKSLSFCIPGLLKIVLQNPGTRGVLYRKPFIIGACDERSTGWSKVVSEKTIPLSVCTVKRDLADIAVWDIRVMVGSISCKKRGCWNERSTLWPRSIHDCSSASATSDDVQDASQSIGGDDWSVHRSMYIIVRGIPSTLGSTPRYRRLCKVACASVGVAGELTDESLEDSESYSKDGAPYISWLSLGQNLGDSEVALGGHTGARSLSTNYEAKINHWSNFRRQEQLTSLPAAGISELLKTAAYLFSSTPLACLFKNPIWNKSVPHWESTKEARFSRIIRLIILKSCCSIKILNQSCHEQWTSSSPSMRDASSSGGQTTSPPLKVFQLLRPFTMDWNTSCVAGFLKEGQLNESAGRVWALGCIGKEFRLDVAGNDDMRVPQSEHEDENTLVLYLRAPPTKSPRGVVLFGPHAYQIRVRIAIHWL